MKKIMVMSALVAIILCGLFAYGSSLRGMFVWDDDTLVKDNAYIKNWSHGMHILGADIGAGAGERYNFYRPVQVFSYAFDYSIWKLNPFGYHLTNTLLHIIASLLVMWFLYILFGDFFIAWLSALLFCIHPVQTEAVAYISGRADSLALIFMLLSFIFYLKNSKPITLIFSFVCFALALLSKELALIFPLLLLLHHFVFRKKINLKNFAGIAIVAASYIILRLTALKSIAAATATDATLLQRLPGFFVALASYVRLLVLPYNLHMEYGSKLFSITDPMAINGVAIFVLLCVVIVALRKPKPIIAFAVGWFLVALIPQSNLFPINAFMAEHWLYVPLIGAALFAAHVLAALYRSPANKKITALLILSIIVALFVLTRQQSIYWRDPKVFYEKTLVYAPKSYKMHNLLGLEYKKSADYAAALASFNRSLALNPDNARVYINMGSVYADIQNDEIAAQCFRKALTIRTLGPSESADALGNLAGISKRQGRLDEAIMLYKKALAMNPTLAEAHNNLANVYVAKGDIEEAIREYNRAIALRPDYAEVFCNIGKVYGESGNHAQAVPYFKKAIALNRRYADAYYNLGVAYNSLGKYGDAVAEFKKTVEIDPRHGQAYKALAIISLNQQDFAAAQQYYEKAKKLGVGDQAIEAAFERLKTQGVVQ